MEQRQVVLPLPGADLAGSLTVPDDARGLIVFAHGSGSSRMSPRNVHVADKLNAGGFATLLFDLLTGEEDADHERRFDIPLLSQRLVAAVDWSRGEPETSRFSVGLFGASTGAAAALQTASHRPDVVEAAVSRGGRPDLAMESLPNVHSPTLLIVGSLDDIVIDLNRQALARLPHETAKELHIVSGASHLFEEQGKMDRVSDLALGWFAHHLSGSGRPGP